MISFWLWVVHPIHYGYVCCALGLLLGAALQWSLRPDNSNT